MVKSWYECELERAERRLAELEDARQFWADVVMVGLWALVGAGIVALFV